MPCLHRYTFVVDLFPPPRFIFAPWRKCPETWFQLRVNADPENLNLFKFLSTLAHPATRVRFPRVPALPILLAAYVFEAYSVAQHRLLHFFPALFGDISFLQPATFQVASLHIVFDCLRARDELGYQGRGDCLGPWKCSVFRSRNGTRAWKLS